LLGNTSADFSSSDIDTFKSTFTPHQFPSHFPACYHQCAACGRIYDCGNRKQRQQNCEMPFYNKRKCSLCANRT